MRYGDFTNTLVFEDDYVIKYSKDEEKLNYEKQFYHKCKYLNLPNVLSWSPFTIERIHGRHATYEDYENIIKSLTNMHSKTEKDVVCSCVRLEIYDKLVKRYKPCIHKEYINGIKIKTYEQALNFMKTVEIPKLKTCMIHGDPHFDNIIIKDDCIYFIDPRGYFGDLLLFGISEYDIAKVHFSLSGYNYFENMKDYSFDDTIDIPIHEKSFDIDFFTHVLLCSIWLGNSHAYTGDKFVMSRHFALYIFTLFCLKYKIEYI